MTTMSAKGRPEREFRPPGGSAAAKPHAWGDHLVNDTLLRALRREPTPYVPIWLMRQAGRYLPEYAALRARAGSFMALATNPSLAAEVTLQPLARFPLDAAILFSDILTVPDAMGLGLRFADGEGPRFARTTADEQAIASLTVPDLARLRYVFDAIAETKRALAGRVPLIGFAGSPFTLACYMIEGHGSADFATVRRMAFARPDLLDRLVRINADAVSAYLSEQARAGAEALMLFDTWGGLLSPAAYRRFSLAPTRSILARLPAGVPTIVFTKGAAASLPAIVESGASCIGLDWTADLAEARRRFGRDVAFQGNLDPLALLTDPESVERAASALIEDSGPAAGYVFNVGHGLVPATPPENVAALVAAVHRASPSFNGSQSAPGSGPRRG
ncbi:MAG TPA: uroporphyrinogen decarboxylase [Casimicrobiaceae bacterium]|nr:uroporphyrinogen decarboxylase [Casimicrobiaceae bacterium]